MENLTLSHNLQIAVLDASTDEPLRILRVKNLVPDCGVEKMLDLFCYPNRTGDESGDDYGDGKTPTYFALGTNGSVTTASMTTLGMEVFRSQIFRRTRLVKSRLFYYYISPSEANGNTLQEVGFFSEPSGGSLWARATHGAISKTSSVAITYEWTFSLGAS